MAAKTAGAEDGVDVAALTPDRVERLRAVFWDMCSITTEVGSIEHEDSNETILHITITVRTADEMRTVYTLRNFKTSRLPSRLRSRTRWGTLQMVRAPGNSTSGACRPYGMDCSGCVD